MITDEEWLEMLDYEFKLVCKAQREYCLYTTQYNHIDIGCTKEELDDFLLYCKEYKIIISNYNVGMIALKIEEFKKGREKASCSWEIGNMLDGFWYEDDRC